MKTFDLRTDMHKDEENSTRKKIVFMGTGSFALPILEALLADKDNVDVVAVITKPDAKIGRGNKSDRALHKNPIKDTTLSQGIHLSQPQKITDKVIDEIKNYAPDMLIVASYGKILPQKLLDAAPLGAINVHASLLPRLRGASPIQNAIMQGDTETGVTIMQMDSGLDTGAILAQAKIAIEQDDSTQTLEKKLSQLGQKTIMEILTDLFEENIEAQDQDESQATLCQMIDRDDGHIVWMNKTETLLNRYRALTPWPGLFSFWKKTATDTIRIKLLSIEPYTGSMDLTPYTPATVFASETGDLCVRTIDSAFVINTLQRDGKIVMDAKQFLNGNPDIIGTTLA